MAAPTRSTSTGAGTDLRLVDIDLSGTAGGGDEQPDVVTVDGTARADNIDIDAVGDRVDVSAMKTDVRISGGELIDTLRIDALGGNDDVDVARGGPRPDRRRRRPGADQR